MIPCGFMRMRGTLAGPERTRVTRDIRELALTLPDDRDIDIVAIAGLLAAAPAAERATRVTAAPAQLFDGLGLWLALHEPRWGTLTEPATGAGLARAPLAVKDHRMTAGVFSAGGFAVLARPSAQRAPGPPGSGPAAGGQSPVFELTVLGYGPAGPDLADELAAQVQAWATARPGSSEFSISGYPRPGTATLPAGAVIDRPHTAFVVGPA